jgi:DNA-directed RNA polymerase delta subunit
MEVEQSHANTGEIEMSQEKIKQFQDLSSNIKNLLGNNEKENLALIAKFYSQLILSNLI